MGINDPQQNLSVKITFYFNILKQSISDCFWELPVCMIRLANYSPYKRIIYLAIKNLLQYDKNLKIIKVKRGTSTFVPFFVRKFLLKLTLKTYVIHAIVITQSWFHPRTLAHLQWEKISNKRLQSLRLCTWFFFLHFCLFMGTAWKFINHLSHISDTFLKVSKYFFNISVYISGKYHFNFCKF